MTGLAGLAAFYSGFLAWATFLTAWIIVLACDAYAFLSLAIYFLSTFTSAADFLAAALAAVSFCTTGFLALGG